MLMKERGLLISRVAVSTFFFVNGFLYANWTSRLPELQRFYVINDAQLGAMLFCIALGSIVAMPLAGWMGHRFGSARLVTVVSILYCLAIPLVAYSRDEWVIRLCFFFLGAANGSMDVAMNGQAVLVERRWGSMIFSSFHAVFSIGMALGALCGGIFSDWGIGLSAHLGSLAIIGGVFIGWASTRLLPEPLVEIGESDTGKPGTKRHVILLILPFGLIAFCCMTGEGSMVDWSALFVNKVVGQSEKISAWAFGSFGVAMTVGRLYGDKVIERYGKFRVLQMEALLAILGMVIVIVFSATWSSFVGFFMIGLGLAVIVPIVFSSAGNVHGVSPSVGISMATSIGYAGFFIGPPVIGYLGEMKDLRLGFGFVLFLFVLMYLLIKFFVGREEESRS